MNRTRPDERLVALLIPELERLFPGGGVDPIAAGTIATAIEREGWRRVTAQSVEEAMNRVGNLGVEAYEPTISEFTEALLLVA